MNDDIVDVAIARVANAIRYNDLEAAKIMLSIVPAHYRNFIMIAAKLLASKCD